MGVGGQCHAPATLPMGKRCSTHYTGGWVGPRTGLDRVQNISPPLGFNPWTIQHIASHYTDYTTRPMHTEKWVPKIAGSYGPEARYIVTFCFSCCCLIVPRLSTSSWNGDGSVDRFKRCLPLFGVFTEAGTGLARNWRAAFSCSRY
jgi:hypothetical protein